MQATTYYSQNICLSRVDYSNVNGKTGCESALKEDSGALEDDSDCDDIILIKTIVTELTTWQQGF